MLELILQVLYLFNRQLLATHNALNTPIQGLTLGLNPVLLLPEPPDLLLDPQLLPLYPLLLPHHPLQPLPHLPILPIHLKPPTPQLIILLFHPRDLLLKLLSHYGRLSLDAGFHRLLLCGRAG